MSAQGAVTASQEMADLLDRVAIDDEPYFHWAYDDAESGADLVVQTTDGVNFRVHSYYLKANSTYFRSMPVKGDIPPVEGADTTVHIEANSATFKFILDLVTDADSCTDEDCDFEFPDSLYAVDEVLEVGHRLGFTQLPRMMLPIMHKHVASSPWYVLKFAAKNDFMVLAIYAIERMATDAHFKTLSVFDIVDHMLDEVPSRYVAPLIRNMTLFRMDDGAADWEKVAHNFPHIREGRNGSDLLSALDSRARVERSRELDHPADAVFQDWSAEGW